VIEANGGALDRIVDGEALYWLATSQQGARADPGSLACSRFAPLSKATIALDASYFEQAVAAVAGGLVRCG
jgi:hypothetical protein